MGKKKPIYKRIILKIGGESLGGEDGTGLDFYGLNRIANEIKKIRKEGIDVGIVIGGGNIFRGIPASKKGFDRVAADYMGMLATVINALALQDVLEKIGVFTRVQTAIEMNKIAEPLIRRKAIRHMEKGRVVIFAAGTGNPYFSTDTAASLRAIEIGADVLLKATKVDGVYNKDPFKYKDAVKYDKADYLDVINGRLKVMDLTAVSLCMDNEIPIIVFNVKKENSIIKVLHGDKIGTLIGSFKGVRSCRKP